MNVMYLPLKGKIIRYVICEVITAVWGIWQKYILCKSSMKLGFFPKTVHVIWHTFCELDYPNHYYQIREQIMIVVLRANQNIVDYNEP